MKALQLILLLTFIMLAASFYAYAQDKVGTIEVKKRFSWKWEERVPIKEAKRFTNLCGIVELNGDSCKEISYEFIFFPRRNDALVVTANCHNSPRVKRMISISAKAGDNIYFAKIRLKINNQIISIPNKAFTFY